MKVSDIQIKLNPKTESHIAATVNFTLADKILFFGWQIIKKKAGGVFLSPPQRKIGDKFFSLIRFTEKSWNEEITTAVIDEFNKMTQPEPQPKPEQSEDDSLWGGDDDLPF